MKNALKKAISILLAAVMVFGAAPLAGFVGLELPSLFDFRAEAASYSGTCGMNLTWELNNGHLSISGNGDMRNWDGSDFAPWYPYNESIYSVEIGDGVTSIGKNAFMYCAVLTSVTFGDSVTKIGDWAFHNCTRLNTISFPDTVTSIGGNALIGTGFRKNSANWENGALYCGKHLTEVSTTVSGSYTIKEGTLSIADGVFYNSQGNLDGLTNVTLPDSLKSIGSSAFYNCIGLTNITIPNGVKTIGKSAFESTSLSEIIIPDGTTSIGYRVFYNCSNLKNAEISDSVTLIGDNAFYDCVSLETVTIGKGVETIGYNAFFDCTNITDVFYNGTQTEWNKIFIDEGNEVLLNANIHCTQTEITGDCGDNLTWKLNLSTGELVISGTGDMWHYSTNSSTEKAPWYSHRSSIKSVTISDGVTSIGNNAFFNCDSLTSITIPDRVTSLGEDTFDSCINLVSVKIPESVTSIGSGVFSGCTSLERITIPDSITSIGSYAFFSCYSLANIAIPDSVTSIGFGAFGQCYALKSVIIGNGVKTIGGMAFAFCKKLEGVTIPNGVTIIEEALFVYCDSLTNVIVGKGVTIIHEDAFGACSSLISITVDDDNPVYSSNEDGVLFNKNKTELIIYPAGNPKTNYAIPDTVTSIGECAFALCEKLECVHIPTSVTLIADSSFYGTPVYICSETEDCYAKEYAVVNGIEFRLCVGHGSDGHSHSLGKWVTIVDPSCTSEGSKIKFCTECGEEIETDKIDSLDHDIVIDESVDATCTETGLTKGQHCSRCDDMTVNQEVIPVKPHNHTAKYDSAKHWKECACGSIIDEQNHSFVGGNDCSCGFKRTVNSAIKIKNNNGSKTINYGETLKLTAIVTSKPSNAKIYWYIDGEKKGEGDVFNVKFESGTKIITVKLVDSNGVVYQNANGDEIADSENITVKVGFFQKLISFFKNLFGMNRTVVQTIFKGMY